MSIEIAYLCISYFEHIISIINSIDTKYMMYKKIGTLSNCTLLHRFDIFRYIRHNSDRVDLTIDIIATMKYQINFDQIPCHIGTCHNDDNLIVLDGGG